MKSCHASLPSLSQLPAYTFALHRVFLLSIGSAILRKLLSQWQCGRETNRRDRDGRDKNVAPTSLESASEPAGLDRSPVARIECLRSGLRVGKSPLEAL